MAIDGTKGRMMNTQVALLVLILGTGHNLLAQTAGAFTATGSMTTPRMGHSATLLNNGKVLIAGGWQNVPGGQHCEGSLHFRSYVLDCVSRITSAELYDPSTGAFSPTGNLTGEDLYHTATLLPSGKVLISWGSSAELYDPSSGTFTAIAGMAPEESTATLLNNGKVLFTGRPATLYDPTDGTLVATGDYAGTPGNLGPATLLPDGRVLIAGNLGCCYALGQTQIYDPNSGTFSLTAPVFSQSNGSNTATLLENGKVLAAGGGDVNDDSYSPIEAGLYNPAAGTFLAVGSMTMARADDTATLLPDGTVFIAGGDFVSGSSTEVYDPAAERFFAIGNMVSPRLLPTATLLPDGRVLIAGGLPNAPATTSTAELYAPPSLTASPFLLSLSGDGQGQGAIQHAGTVQIASPSNPARAGEALAIYCTGLADGSFIPPRVTIGGRLAEVLWFGKTPGYVELNQINVRVPRGVAPGPAIPVRITYLSRPSNEITIGVQ
jgi:hypothetical protein